MLSFFSMASQGPASAQATTPYGEVLRNLRLQHSWSLREIERRTGGSLKSGHLSQIETGKVAQPSLSVLRTLARAFGLEFSTLLNLLNYADEGAPPVLGDDRMALLYFRELEPGDREHVIGYMRYLAAQRRAGAGEIT